MAATPSLRVVKSFTYRGVPKHFSNRYHFNGGVPANDSAWHTLMDAVTTAEKAIYDNTVQIIQAVGYAAGSEVPVSTKTYSLNGTAVWSGPSVVPGDVAGLIRYATAARSSKNHPVYLFNYYHGVVANGANRDQLFTAQNTAFGVYAAAWLSGFSDGSTSYVRAGPNGATATGYLVEAFLTHRDFPR